MPADTDTFRRSARVDATLRQQRKAERLQKQDEDMDEARELPDDALRRFIRDIGAQADDLW